MSSSATLKQFAQILGSKADECRDVEATTLRGYLGDKVADNILDGVPADFEARKAVFQALRVTQAHGTDRLIERFAGFGYQLVRRTRDHFVFRYWVADAGGRTFPDVKFTGEFSDLATFPGPFFAHVYLHYHLNPKFSAVQKGKRTVFLRSLRENWAAAVAEHADTERELAAVKEERERRAIAPADEKKAGEDEWDCDW